MTEDSKTGKGGPEKATPDQKSPADSDSAPRHHPMLRTLKTGWRGGILIMLEGLAVVAVLLAGLAAIAVWRLKSGPVDISFARDYIEGSLRNPATGVRAKMEGASLYWPDLKGPLLLRLQEGRILNAAGKAVISVGEVSLGLSRARLLMGRIAPVSIILTRPSVRLIRTASGFNIGFDNGEDSLPEEAEEQADIAARILEHLGVLGRAEEDGSPLASLRAIVIRDAALVFEDHLRQVSWFFPHFDISLESAGEDLHSSFAIHFPDVRGVESYLKADGVFLRDMDSIVLNADLKNFDVRILGAQLEELAALRDQDVVLNGTLETVFGSDLRPRTARGQVSSARGNVFAPLYSGDPVPYEDMALSFVYRHEPQALGIDNLRIAARGVTLQAKGILNRAADGRITGPVRLSIDQLEQAQISPLWPDMLRGDNSEEWIVRRLSGGTFSDLYVRLDLAAQQSANGAWNINASDMEAGFAFEDMTIDYRPPLPPVSRAAGEGKFIYDEERLNIRIEGAQVGDLAVPSADVELVNIIEEGAGVADINLTLQGPLQSVFRYIEKEPISLGDNLGFDVAGVEGQADLKVNVGFPTVKDIRVEDVKVGVEGSMREVKLPALLKGLDLTGGPLALKVDNEAYTVKGKAALGGRDVTFDWKEFLESEGRPYKYTVTAAAVTDPALREHFGIVLDDFLEGPVPVTLDYTAFRGGRAEADVKTDLTRARLFFEPFAYEKKPGIQGGAQFRAHFRDENLKTIDGLTAGAPEFTLESSQLDFRRRGDETELAGGRFSRAVIGESVIGSTFEFSRDGAVDIALDGPVLDVRPFLEDDENQEPYDAPPMRVSVRADSLITADGDKVGNGKIYMDIDREGRFNQLEIDAKAGKGQIYLRFKPDETGKRVFRLEADDAGAALRAFGLYDNVIGGVMTVYGQPIRGVYDRNLVGKALLKDFRVIRAPALARLLGAMSLPGLMALLNNEGVTFTRLEADFDWLYRRRGSLLVLKNGRTSGNSLGLTFDGVFDHAENTLDVSGTLIPLSGVNKLVGNIPVIGEILGGSGGVFAATYKMEGKADHPEITVNPLSVLAPGILRRILFEGGG